MSKGPLAGVRIVEIASLAPAPYGVMLLADLGAEVLRVERLAGEPTFAGPVGPLDRGRRSVALDLKTPRGVEVLLELLTDADVLVEGFRPGTAERLGFGPDVALAANPRLVYGRMTGWGQDGPLSLTAGHDINYIAVSGALEPVGRAGERPHAPLNLLGDFAGGGSFLALGILAALFERETSGLGQVVDAAMTDGSAVLTSFVYGMRAAGRWGDQRGTNLLDGGAPFYDTYETSDGRYVAVGALEPQFFATLATILGLGDDVVAKQYDESTWPSLRETLRGVFLSRTRDDWADAFEGTDACVSPVLSPAEAEFHPHNRSRATFVDIAGLTQPAPAPRFSRSAPPTPSALDATGRDPLAALVGWGIGREHAERLAADGVIG